MFIDRLHFSVHDPLLRMSIFLLADWFTSSNGKYFIQQILTSAILPAVASEHLLRTTSKNDSTSHNYLPSASKNDHLLTNAHIHPQWTVAVDYLFANTRNLVQHVWCAIVGYESSACYLASAASAAGVVRDDDNAQQTTAVAPQSSSTQTDWLEYGWSLLADAASQSGTTSSHTKLDEARESQEGYWTEVVANSLQFFALWLALIIKPYYLIAMLWVVEECFVACCVTYINLLAIQNYRSASLMLAACFTNIFVVRILRVPAEFDRQAYTDVAHNSIGTDTRRLFTVILAGHKQLSRLYTSSNRRSMCYHLTSALPLARLVMDIFYFPPFLANSLIICALPLTGLGHMWLRLILHTTSCVCGIMIYYAQSAFYNLAALCGASAGDSGGSAFGPERVVSFIVNLGFNDYALILWLHAAAYYWIARMMNVVLAKFVVPFAKNIYFNDQLNTVDKIDTSSGAEVEASNGKYLAHLISITCSSKAALIGLAEVIRQILTNTSRTRGGGLLGWWRQLFSIRSTADTNARRRLEFLKAAHANFLLLFLHAYLMRATTNVEHEQRKRIENENFTKVFLSAVAACILWYIHRQLPSLAASTVKKILTESWEEQLTIRQHDNGQRTEVEHSSARTNEKLLHQAEAQRTKIEKFVERKPSAATKAVRLKLLKIVIGSLIMPGCIIFTCRFAITTTLYGVIGQQRKLTSFYWFISLQTYVWLLDICVQTVLTCANILLFLAHMEQSFDGSSSPSLAHLHAYKNLSAKRQHIHLLFISVMRQLWTQFGIYLCTLLTIGFSGTLFVLSSHPFQWSAYEYVVALYILIRFLSICNQLTKNFLRGIKADIPCNYVCVLSRLPTLTRAEVEQLRDACAICRVKPTTEEFDSVAVVRLHCGHFYHKDCIGDWLKIQMTCCMCNSDVLPEGVPRSIIWRPLASAAAAGTMRE